MSSDLADRSNEIARTSSESFDTTRIGEVKSWLVSQFDLVGKDYFPEFEYTPRTISHLHNLASVSQAKTQAASILANDFRLKASEYRSQVSLAKLMCFAAKLLIDLRVWQRKQNS